ncbi:SurA N-terminal domain-containing protein [Methylophaga thalassica]|uniref:SurA N-terminal domain-containing protein n=1 Tax=Methylophaga thalassica TaxID=40223 RepID=UPI003618D004
MIKYLIVGLLLATNVWAQSLDKIVAVVNDEVILESDLQDMEQTIRQQIRQRDAAMPPSDILRKQVLERLIMQRLQIQDADKVGIRVGDDALNAALKQIADKNQLTLRQFRDVLEKDGYDFSQFRETIRDEMIIARLRKSQVEDRVVVSDREVDNFLATQKIQDGGQVEYDLQHILISLPEAASPEEVQAAQEKLEKVQALLKEGAIFLKLLPDILMVKMRLKAAS